MLANLLVKEKGMLANLLVKEKGLLTNLSKFEISPKVEGKLKI
jgi:hypothetical protein